MSVTPSNLIAATAAPTDPSQLWATPYVFTNNWGGSAGGVTIHQSFMTDVIQAQSGLEQRRALTLCPSRVLEVELLIKGAKQIGYFRAWLARAAVSRFLFPVYPDRIQLVSGRVGSVVFASGLVGDRRYFVGARFAIVQFDIDRMPTYYSVETIDSIAFNTLFFTSATNYSFVNSTYFIFPLIEAELLLDYSDVIMSAGILDANLVIAESRGNYSLDCFNAIGSNPGGLSFGGYPLLNIEPDGLADGTNTNKMGINRMGSYTQNGRGKVLQLFDSRGRFDYELTWTQLTKAKSAALIRWFEAMGGRYLPFYLLSPLTDFKVVSFTGTTVTVETGLLALDIAAIQTIGVLMTDGSYQIRTVTGSAQSGNNWIFTVATWSVLPTLATIKRCALVQLVRFNVDEMIELWTTDGVMSTTLALIELTAENSLTIANIKDFTQGYM